MFRLALALGKTVGELLTTIDAPEIAEWQAFDAIEPIGPERHDLLAAMLAAVTVNVNRAQGTAPAKLSDFLLEYGAEPDEPMSLDAIKAALTQMTAIANEAHAKGAPTKAKT